MFRTTALLLAATTVIGLSACGSDKTTSTAASTPASTTPTSVTGSSEPSGTESPGTAPETTPATTAETTPDSTPDSTPAMTAPPDLTTLVGRTWVPTSFITVGPLDEIPLSLGASVVFGDDGTVLVNTGCNSGSGSVTFDGDQMTIGPITLTKKACADDVMALEQRIVGLLEEPSYWGIEGDTLKIYPANVTDTGIIFQAVGALTPTSATFQTTS